MKGRRDEALNVLTRLRGSENLRAVELELSEVEAIIELERESMMKLCMSICFSVSERSI